MTMSEDHHTGPTPVQAFLKRTFDIVGALCGLMLTGAIILFAYIAASLDTRANGFFTQQRVGRGGRLIRIVKIRTMRDILGLKTTVTTDRDPRITKMGRFFRKTKIDELPQLFNVLAGQMSFVGPRPDVPGFADQLQGADLIILAVRPGITGPATLKYRNEETLLSRQNDPERYNREVIFPAKLLLNRAYVENYSLYKDMIYILQTILPVNPKID